MTWWTYVERVAQTSRQRDIAERVGVDPSNITRWKSGPPRAETVAAFARAYGRPVAEAFVAAGFMTPQEARVPADAATDPGDLTDDQLLAEIRTRLKRSMVVPGGQIEGGEIRDASIADVTVRPRSLGVAAHEEAHSIEDEQEADQDA